MDRSMGSRAAHPPPAALQLAAPSRLRRSQARTAINVHTLQAVGVQRPAAIGWAVHDARPHAHAHELARTAAGVPRRGEPIAHGPGSANGTFSWSIPSVRAPCAASGRRSAKSPGRTYPRLRTPLADAICAVRTDQGAGADAISAGGAPALSISDMPALQSNTTGGPAMRYNCSCKPAPCPTVMDSCGIDDICPRDCPRPRPRSKAATDPRDPCGCTPTASAERTPRPDPAPRGSHCLRAERQASRTPLAPLSHRSPLSPASSELCGAALSQLARLAHSATQRHRSRVGTSSFAARIYASQPHCAASVLDGICRWGCSEHRTRQGD
ncbi:hypothetical protein K466DRAFT_161739 [Polyporus arcularius HHB13444]|uniref:Uncharacterized protein n=1 Tax=Polyporus arcularius HHB13444 TaxID=1314778 RepID=A0A5C3PWL8_9APHY|nr:hypothetical protein K466DRAFT_161739 [Polyporus arcularius HHB13444]